jgi:hypothetical protein
MNIPSFCRTIGATAGQFNAMKLEIPKASQRGEKIAAAAADIQHPGLLGQASGDFLCPAKMNVIY